MHTYVQFSTIQGRKASLISTVSENVDCCLHTARGPSWKFGKSNSTYAQIDFSAMIQYSSLSFDGRNVFKKFKFSSDSQTGTWWATWRTLCFHRCRCLMTSKRTRAIWIWRYFKINIATSWLFFFCTGRMTSAGI